MDHPSKKTPIFVVRAEIWQHPNIKGIYRGGGNNSTNSKLLNPFKNPPNLQRLKKDLAIYQQGHQSWVRKDSSKGLSFATSVDRLVRKGVRGRVYALKPGFILPEGLCFNIKANEEDHPLLNVTRQMLVGERQSDGHWVWGEFVDKLMLLDQALVKTNVEIQKTEDKVLKIQKKADGLEI